MNNIIRLTFLIICIICASAIVSASEVDIKIIIEEHGRFFSFFDEYYVVNINGSLTVNNPTEIDLFGVSIPVDFNTLQFNIQKNDAEVDFNGFMLTFPRVNRNDSLSFDYEIYGITSDKRFKSEEGIMSTAVDHHRTEASPQSVGTLKKAELEDISSGGRTTTRLITAQYSNPTDFSYSIDSMIVIKTGGLDLNQELARWEFEKEGRTLGPGEVWIEDFIDDDAYEGEIYWLKTNLYISNVYFNQTNNISYFTQDELYIPPQNMTNITENITVEEDYLIDRVFMRKTLSQSLVNPGDIVEVTLLINNFAPYSIERVRIQDTIPSGFRFHEVRGATTSQNNIEWTDLTLNARETRRITYYIEYIDNQSLGVDYFDTAQLRYDRKTIYSQAVPYVRKYVPERKLMVQKSIYFISDDEARVTISLHNVGQETLRDLILSELLASDSTFRDVSKTAEDEGIWNIHEINRGDKWEVSYVTDTQSLLNTFPTVHGIKENDLLRTVVLSNVVESEPITTTFNAIEVWAPLWILLVIIMMAVPLEFFSFRKRKELNEIKDMEEDIEELLDKTEIYAKKADNITLKQRQELNSNQNKTTQAKRDIDNNEPKDQRSKIREKTKKELEESNKKITKIKEKTSS